MKKLTKKQQQLLNNYNTATATTLDQIYTSASIYKWRAYYNILNDCKNNNGYNVKCFNANNMRYSMAYTYEKDGNTFVKYFTACNTYIIPTA